MWSSRGAQLVFFDPLQRRIGLGPIGCVGALFLGYGQSAFFAMELVPLPMAYLLFASGCGIGIVGMTFGDATVSPAISAAAVSEQQGAALSLGALSAYAGKMAAPILFGFLYDHVSHGMPFAVAAVACASSVLFCLWFIAVDDRRRSDGGSGSVGGAAATLSVNDLRKRAALDGVEQLQVHLKEILLSRKYKTHLRSTVIELCAVLDKAFPPTAEAEDEMGLLTEQEAAAGTSGVEARPMNHLL